jgi:hypothetical protein
MKIASYHAKALDKIGSSYFIEENYDDFYMVSRLTPDINGSVGILFEQASSRGHAQESANGIITFRLREINSLQAYLLCKQPQRCAPIC